jgi:hypothetical protein
MINYPEFGLLVGCAKSRMGPRDEERIRALLDQKPEWEQLLRLAAAHGLIPLLYRNLSTLCPDAVPETVLEYLKQLFLANARRNLLLTGELLRLLRAFETRGLPVIPYKGPTLAALAYGDLALRQFNDLDLLVRRRDATKSRELLAALGYENLSRLTGGQEAAFHHSEREYSFVHEETGVDVEVQWEIVARYFSAFIPIDADYLVESLKPVSVGGSTVLSPSPEDLLLILCAHGSRHVWGRLVWICDIAELVRRHQTIDWDRLLARAADLGGLRMLHLGLFLANDLLGADPPEKVLRRIRADSEVESLAVQVYQHLVRGPDDFGRDATDSAFSRYHLMLKERWRDRVKYVISRTTLPIHKDWGNAQLPAYLSFLYYGLRPLRLIRDYGRNLRRRLRGS